MANYSVTNGSSGGAAVATGFKTLLSISASTGGTPRRGKIYDVLVGTNGTPADNFMVWDISRKVDTVGTSIDVTAQALDPADAAADTQAFQDYSSEPTITASSAVFSVGVNQRASYRWVAAPGGELVWPASAGSGFGLRVLSGGYTGTATGTMHFTEL